MHAQLRYLIFIILFLVFAGAVFVGFFFRSYVLDNITSKSLNSSSLALTENYSESLWCKYIASYDKVKDIKINELRENKTYKSFEKLSKRLLSIYPSLNILAYNNKNELLFKINNNEIIYLKDQPIAYNTLNSTITRTLKHSSLQDQNSILHKDKILIQSVVPLSGSNCSNNSLNNTKIFLEINYDATDEWNKLTTIQYFITGGFVGTFILIYLILVIMSHKSEKIISKQHEENLALTEAKVKAEAQNKEKSMFLANVSHELRTPLNAIIGFSEIIKDESLGPISNQQYKEYITDINSSGIHLLSLINDILDYSKAEARKLEVEAVDVDLTKISDNSMRLVEPRAKEAKVNLKMEIPEKHIILTADPKRLKQVVLNLLSNSVKFTPEGGEVKLKITENALNNEVEIIIQDTGIGIEAKDISKALSPFGQVDSALSRRYEGTGLGLPLTKKLTEIMGGSFDLKSEPGLGTTVTLVFPLTQAKKEKPEETKKF